MQRVASYRGEIDCFCIQNINWAILSIMKVIELDFFNEKVGDPPLFLCIDWAS